MKKHLIIPVLLFTLFSLSAQNLDLIITSGNDSIACKILSDDGNAVYFQGRMNGAVIESLIKKEEIREIKYNAVIRNQISRIPGTMFFKNKPVLLDDYKRNAIYGTIGSILLYGHILINYDHIFFYDPYRSFKGLILKAGIGSYYIFDIGGFTFRNTVGTLLGNDNKRYLELTAGYHINFDKYGMEFLPAGSLGYRYQKPKGFLFRMGIGYPEYLYLSLGAAF